MRQFLVAAGVVCMFVPMSAARQAVPPRAANAQVDLGIRDLLRQYSTALENLDAYAVKKVQPSIEAENLRKAFRDMRTLMVTIDDVRVLATDDSTARVSCRVAQTLIPKAGSKRETTVTRVMRLRRQAGSWIIETFER